MVGVVSGRRGGLLQLRLLRDRYFQVAFAVTSDTMTHYSQLIKMKNEAIDQAAARYMHLLNNNKKSASPLQIRGTTSFSQARSSLMSDSKRDVKHRIIKLIQKRFKNPYNAFCQMDYDGKGIIVKDNFYASLADIHNHVSLQQVESFFKREQVFQAPPNHTLDLQRFMKVFYPSVRAQEEAEEDAEDGSSTHKSAGRSHSDQISKTSLEDRLRKVEELLKEKLLVNYKSARKAFLELDSNFDGLIEAKELAMRLMNTTSLAEGDLKMLFKLKSSRADGKLTFQDFITWFGPVIEPPSQFYFRHDESHQLDEKGPGNGQWKNDKDFSTQSIESKLKSIIHTQWKSVKKAFMDLNRHHCHFIEKPVMQQFMLVRCGFKMSEKEFDDFFSKVDKDGDGRLSYQDFNDYFGYDISPSEDLFFRQQAPLSKRETAQIIRKWEFNTSQLNHEQMKQTQKINKGHTLLESIAGRMGESEWKQLLKKLSSEDKRRDYTIDADSFFGILESVASGDIVLDGYERECIHEAFMSTHDPSRINIHQLVSLKNKADLEAQTRRLRQAPPSPLEHKELYKEVLDILETKGHSEGTLVQLVERILAKGNKKKEEDWSYNEVILQKLREKVGDLAVELSSDKFKPILVYLLDKQILHKALHSKQRSRMITQDELSQILSHTEKRNQRGRNKSLGMPSLFNSTRGRCASVMAENSTIDIPDKEPLVQIEPPPKDLSVDGVDVNSTFDRKLQTSNSVGNLRGSFFKTAGSFMSSSLNMERKFRILKTKLEYEWPNVYRTLVSRDLDQMEKVSIPDFKGALLRSGIYLDKENWKTVMQFFVEGDPPQVIYKEMSNQLGLHRSCFESINSTRLKGLLQRIQNMKKPIHREPRLPALEKSASQKSFTIPVPPPQDRMKALQRKKGTLRRLFRNFDQSNNSHVSQHQFLNITNKLGAKLTQRDIEPFEDEEPKRKLRLNDSTRQINYRKFLDRLQAAKK